MTNYLYLSIVINGMCDVPTTGCATYEITVTKCRYKHHSGNDPTTRHRPSVGTNWVSFSVWRSAKNKTDQCVSHVRRCSVSKSKSLYRICIWFMQHTRLLYKRVHEQFPSTHSFLRTFHAVFFRRVFVAVLFCRVEFPLRFSSFVLCQFASVLIYHFFQLFCSIVSLKSCLVFSRFCWITQHTRVFS